MAAAIGSIQEETCPSPSSSERSCLLTLALLVGSVAGIMMVGCFTYGWGLVPLISWIAWQTGFGAAYQDEAKALPASLAATAVCYGLPENLLSLPGEGLFSGLGWTGVGVVTVFPALWLLRRLKPSARP